MTFNLLQLLSGVCLCSSTPPIEKAPETHTHIILEILQLRGVTYLRERHINSVSVVALSLSTLAFLVISGSCYGLFGRKDLAPDVLENFTVKALEPLVWTQVARAGGCVLYVI